MIIGLIGAPGAGKNDVAGFILERQYGFSHYAFADNIKHIYFREIGITDEYFKSKRGTKEEEEIRKGLWEFSDKTRKESGPLVFIEPVITGLKTHKIKGRDAVVTDIRMEDELRLVAEVADAIIVIVRDISELEGEDDDIFTDTRLSLQKVKQFPVFINKGELKDSRKRFKDFFMELEENDGPP